jgi:hypothetical protein
VQLWLPWKLHFESGVSVVSTSLVCASAMFFLLENYYYYYYYYYYYAVVFNGIMLLEVCSKVCISRCVWCIFSSYWVKIREHIIHIAFSFAVEYVIGNVWKELKGLALNVSNWVLDYAVMQCNLFAFYKSK